MCILCVVCVYMYVCGRMYRVRPLCVVGRETGGICVCVNSNRFVVAIMCMYVCMYVCVCVCGNELGELCVYYICMYAEEW